MTSGISSENIASVSVSKEVLVNGPEGTGRQKTSDLATQIVAEEAMAEKLDSLASAEDLVALRGGFSGTLADQQAEINGKVGADALAPIEASLTAAQAQIDDLSATAYDGSPRFPTTAAGLAGTSVGGYFRTPSTDPNVSAYIYRHDAGPVATLVETVVSVAGLADKASIAIANPMPQRARAGRLAGDTGFVTSEVRAIIANTFAEFTTGFTVTGGKISVDGTGFGNPPRLFGRGEYRASGVPARVVIEATVDAVGSNGAGVHVGFGSDSASLVMTSWWASGAAGTVNSAGVIVAMRNNGGAPINAGDRARMTVEIGTDNLGTILCENLTTGAVRGVEISTPVPAGPIWAGWMRAVAGTIHSIAVEIGVAALPKVVGPDQREAWPNLVLAPDDWMRNASVAGFGYDNGVLTLTGMGTVDCDLPVIAGQTAITLAFWLESVEAGNPQPQIFLGQFNAAGSGWVSGAEITAARYLISIGTSAIMTRRYYMARVPVNVLAQRLVLRVSNGGAVNTLRISDLLVTYDKDRHYRGRDVASGLADDVSSLEAGFANLSTNMSVMSAKVDALDAGSTRVREVLLADINHSQSSGQSNDIGTGGTPPQTTTQPFNNVMLANGVLDYSADNTGITGTPQSTSLVPLVYTKIGESPGLSAPNMVKAMLIAAGGPDVDFSAANNGRGATLLSGISKGSDAYQWGLDQVARIKSLANAQGKTFVQQSLDLVHGESDNIAPNSTPLYKTGIIQLKNDWNDDSGQEHRIPMLITQVGSHSVRGPSQGWAAPNIAQAQLEASLEDTEVVMVCPTYMMPYNADHVHFPGHSARWIGQYFGKIRYRICILGLDFKATHIMGVQRQGKLIDVRYHVPSGRLEFDTSLVTAAANLGFSTVVEADQTAIGIADVTLRGNDWVRIELADAPSGEVGIRYGWGVGGNSSGPITGARGNIRDTDPTVSYYNNAAGHPYPLQNWAAIQKIVSEGY